jgi:NADH dehydrogenase [ubiquinone] 1 alpha subcomplex assembly factor 5
MEPTGHPPEIFDRSRRHALRARGAGRNGEVFLWNHVADELAERLAMVSRTLASVLIIGPMVDYVARIAGERQCSVSSASFMEEDRLQFEPQSFDLVISGGTLDSVNDLPGALVQIRRILRPDGLFLGHMFGAGSLVSLKSLMMAAEGDVATPHIHPQIDLRSAADLLARAGFALPVADGELARVRYGGWRTIVSDIRDAGIGNSLAGPRRYLGADMPVRMDAEWRRRADSSGKLEEQFNHIFLSGWAPAPDQPKPARRGSGQVSLASVLQQPGTD